MAMKSKVLVDKAVTAVIWTLFAHLGVHSTASPLPM